MGGVSHYFCSAFGFYKFICPRPPHFLSASYAPEYTYTYSLNNYLILIGNKYLVNRFFYLSIKIDFKDDDNKYLLMNVIQATDL